ncbi:MAG: glycosyltransferase family 2 protein [Bacteroidales bacterium]|jgi:glycosyltransferase involved in cell wall biosynthesis|nr:glycosyltransferase family 2 protein [Bacteroidales bacterium]MBR6277535.1 glycosyltransferase family 2 protein [Bacteroidales bacterium]
MINNKKIGIVLPAYNAEKTLEQTFNEIPFDIVDEVILTDDCSKDHTVEVAKKLGIKHIIIHEKNLGYGGNQKSCYKKALELGCDIVVMLHPDYQYTPKLLRPMCYTIADGVYPVIIASRILGKGARRGGMPLYKYVSNRFLTFFQNLMMNQKLSEYHTGYRAFSREVIEKLNLEADSNDFVFDNQMLAQIFYFGYEIAEITCPTKYFKEASSINFRRSVKYGFGVMGTAMKYFFNKIGLIKSEMFREK